MKLFKEKLKYRGRHITLENWAKSGSKYFIKLLLYWISLMSFNIFCEGLSEKTKFFLNSVQIPWNLHFLQLLSPLKSFTILKLIFREIEVWPVATSEILHSGKNLPVTGRQIEAGQWLWKDLWFSSKTRTFL